MFSIIDENSGELVFWLTRLHLFHWYKLSDEIPNHKQYKNVSRTTSKNIKSVKRRVFADIPTNVDVVQPSTQPKFKIIDAEENEFEAPDDNDENAKPGDTTFVKVWRTPVRKSQSLQVPNTQKSCSPKQRKANKSPAINSNYAKFMAAHSELFINNQLLPLPAAQYMNRSGSLDSYLDVSVSPANTIELQEATSEVSRAALHESDTFVIASGRDQETQVTATLDQHQQQLDDKNTRMRLRSLIAVQLIFVLILLIILFYFIWLIMSEVLSFFHIYAIMLHTQFFLIFHVIKTDFSCIQ